LDHKKEANPRKKEDSKESLNIQKHQEGENKYWLLHIGQKVAPTKRLQKIHKEHESEELRERKGTMVWRVSWVTVVG